MVSLSKTKRWIHATGRDAGAPSKHRRLCSKCFEDGSFEINPVKIKRSRWLLKGAVPEKFILGEDGNRLTRSPHSLSGGIRGTSCNASQGGSNAAFRGLWDVWERGSTRGEEWQKELYEEEVMKRIAVLT